MKTITTSCKLDNVIDFINKYADYALETESKYNIPAVAMLAQSALETGWGKIILMVWVGADRISSNNLFNIKVHFDKTAPGVYTADWIGKKGTAKVNEFLTGDNSEVIVNDLFRVYDNARDSFLDYGTYITTRKKLDGTLRYAKAFNLTDPYAYIDAIADAGYATDPSYSKTIKDVIHMFTVTE